MSYCCLDLECGTTEKFGRVSHFMYNDIIAIGTKCSHISEPHVTYLYPNALQDLDIKEDILVMHNAKYDMLYIWSNPGFQRFLAHGGKVFCTMLAEYYLSGQELRFPGLRETAERYGCKAREKRMEPYWERGVDTMDIPKDVVLNDLYWDVMDTEQVYLSQLSRLQQVTPQMSRLLEVQNNLILATTEMEYNGMYVNKQVLLDNMATLESELTEKTQRLAGVVKKYWR